MKPFALPSVPDSFTIRAFAFFWICAYALLYFVFPEVIPEKYLRDAEFIQSLVDGTSSIEGDSSFAAVSAIFSLLPKDATDVFVELLNSYVLWCILKQIASYRGMVLVIPVIIPLALLNMMAPTKDTLVITMSLLIYLISCRSATSFPVLLTIFGAYTAFGIFLRTYYLLILAAFAGFLLLDRLKSVMRLVSLLLFFLVIFILPEYVYQLLEGPRDAVYFDLSSEFRPAVRTMFPNLFAPDSAIHFLGNYLYSFCLLNFPFVMDVTPNEIVLFVNVIIYAWLVTAGIRWVQGPHRLLAFLFLAHIAVLNLFEPDFGSYMRHFSSAFLYLIPALRVREQRYVENLRRITGLAPNIGAV